MRQPGTVTRFVGWAGAQWYGVAVVQGRKVVWQQGRGASSPGFPQLGVAGADELELGIVKLGCETRDLGPVLREERVGSSVGRFPVQVGKLDPPAAVLALQPQVVLDDLGGVEGSELVRVYAKPVELLRPGRMRESLDGGRVGLTELRGLATGDVFGQLGLDCHDLGRRLGEQVEIRRTPGHAGDPEPPFKPQARERAGTEEDERGGVEPPGAKSADRERAGGVGGVEARPASGVVVSLVDLGHRFRAVLNEVDLIEAPQDMPRLPVAGALWKPRPSFLTAAEAWLLAGGSHHTVLSTATTIESWRDFFEIASVELVSIDDAATTESIADKLRWNAVSYEKL
jgi:hypothetical protein